MSSKPTKLTWSVPPPHDEWATYSSWGWRYQCKWDWNGRCQCWESYGNWRFINWSDTARQWGVECRQFRKDAADYRKKILELEQEIVELKKQLGRYDTGTFGSKAAIH